MRKIIDANCLQSQRLEKYLAKSQDNMAVLTDYAAMESYKGSTLKSIFKSMEVLSRYPNQVIILKGTQNVCALKAINKGLQKRFIDRHQTKGFGRYCKNLEKAKNGDKKVERSLLQHGKAANEHMDKVLSDSEGIIRAISETASNYTDNELQILRKREPLTNDLGAKIIRNVLEVTALLHAGHPKVVGLPFYDELYNSFIFRYSLCIYLLALNWISEGGVKGVKPDTMRNDVVDMNYVAYATFFDGLMSKDRKANQIYDEACVVLQKII